MKQVIAGIMFYIASQKRCHCCYCF